MRLDVSTPTHSRPRLTPQTTPETWLLLVRAAASAAQDDPLAAPMEAADKEMVADTLAQTKGLGDTVGTLPDARETTEGIKQGMTLIDRFYNGGNMARQGVADILVTVLDQVIGRMRQRNANAEATINRCKEECAVLDKAIGVLRRTARGPPYCTYGLVLYVPEAQCLPRAPRTVRTPYQPGACCTYRVPWHHRPLAGSRSSSRRYGRSTR